MSNNVQIYKNYELPREAGFYFRLTCLTGDQKGVSHILKGNRIVIGRSEKCDIRILDIKSSREHAEITKIKDTYVITDLNSQNGIFVNDEKTKQKNLGDGDKLVIGNTVFKFSTHRVLENENKNKSSADKKKSGQIDQKTENKKKLSPTILLLFVVLAGSLFLMDESENESSQSPKEITKRNYKSDEYNLGQDDKKKKLKDDKELKKALANIFSVGLREYREGNYFRAMSEFRRALAISPNDPLAEFYFKRTNETLDQLIQEYFINANRATTSLRFQEAINSYCSVIRLLSSYPDDERYKNAVKSINDLELKLGLDVGETNCLQAK